MATGGGVDSKYTKHELRDHIYKLPDTYIGSVESTPIELWLYDEETKMMLKRRINYVPGLYKIFNEILVNALDHIMRLKDEIAKGTTGVKPVKNIYVTIDKKTGRIEVMNDGDGIEIEKHPSYNVYIPQLIFGELLTSSNYQENTEKLWGGKNGYGSKLTNIFSKEFDTETVDHRAKKHYTQSFSNNMKVVEKPSIKASQKQPYTKISFIPDYERFGLTELTDDMFDLFKKRAIDAAASSDISVTVHFNGEKIDVKNFEKYAELFIGNKKEHPYAHEIVNDRWEVLATYSDDSQFEQISFANGIFTLRGGKHVDNVVQNIAKELIEFIKKKQKKEVKPQHVKDNLWIFVKCLIVNPSFDTQTKEQLTTAVSKFGSKCELSAKFFTALTKTGIIDKIVSITDFHQDKKLTKTDGKKKSKLFVPKLLDANKAGTKDSEECTLILAEGDSAVSMVVAGLSVIGRDNYGVYPLRGKILNVKDVTSAKIAENEVITAVKQIMGLQQGRVYTDKKDMRYGRIMALCDSDTDGFHIKALLFNIFQTLWPSLFQMDDFFISLLTPVIKLTHKTNGEQLKFYIEKDYEKWVEKQDYNVDKQWKIKYYKGLGTSSEAEAKEYFREFKTLEYKYTGKESDEAIDLAFNKKRADDRKKWLMSYDPHITLDYDVPEIPYEEFINKEYIHQGNRDLERSINHMCDGLKESLRKIMRACFKRKLFRGELKVAQLAAYVAEHTDYHHGENSLQMALIGMAQDFVGANNINMLKPNGQFGTRLQGGKDHASPRYIFTVLSSLAMLLYRSEDLPILNYKKSEGMIIEPEYYIPILPMVLANGAEGIGTGFSTNVPNHNPSDLSKSCMIIIAAIDKAFNGEDIITKADITKAWEAIHRTKLSLLNPWYLGFKGDITLTKDDVFASRGVYKWIDDNTVEITELPIGTWTKDYEEFLTGLITNNSTVLKDFQSGYTTKNVKFTLKMFPGISDKVKSSFEKDFKLISTKNMSLRNIHLYNESGAVQNYKDTTEVIKDYACIRIEKYVERKKYQLKKLRKEHAVIAAKVRFINDYIAEKVVLIHKTDKEVTAQLKALKYPTFSINDMTEDDEEIFGGAKGEKNEKNEENDEEEVVTELETKKNDANYDYLTNMRLKTLTVEEKRKLEKEEESLRMKIEELLAKTVQSIWKEELEEFNEAWEKYVEEVEAIYEADRLNKQAPKAVKGKGKPKK